MGSCPVGGSPMNIFRSIVSRPSGVRAHSGHTAEGTVGAGESHGPLQPGEPRQQPACHRLAAGGRP